MSLYSGAEEMDRLQFSDEDAEDLWDSPSKRGTKRLNHNPIKQESASPVPRPDRDNETLFDQQEAREAALRNELQSVRNINQVIESLLGSLDRAKGNMETVSRTVNSASILLNTWTRILSQTEHNQSVILNSDWQGASQDATDLENEEFLRQQAVERRERELQQQREAAARKAKEDERKRGTSSRGTRGLTRGRVRAGLGRTPSISYSGTSASGTKTASTVTGTKPSSTATRRPVSGIARGAGVARGRGKV
ncbi:DASH complex subunit Duo1-domain-containing protein [Aspergillus pseudoustus]|uniref:DASH complex subunit DUO1 n=1 Tax=Aspergillus pseudoustus TaxID=1810923 RepID=A0ABR4KT33_9EURO